MAWKEWVAQRKLNALVGLASVDRNESKLARNWGRFFSYTAVLVAIGLLWQWQLDLLHEIDAYNHTINWFVWIYFIAEYVILLFAVRNKWRLVRQNWLLPIIILLGFTFVLNLQTFLPFLKSFRPLLAIFILIPSMRLLAEFFIDGKLKTTLLAALIIVIIFGVLVAGIDPAIKTAWDGIWWAAATVSTVGYGDVVPVSPLGRLLGMGLIVMGLGVFVVITANFLALTLRRETEMMHKGETEIDQLVKAVQAMREEHGQVLDLLQAISMRIKNLEK